MTTLNEFFYDCSKRCYDCEYYNCQWIYNRKKTKRRKLTKKETIERAFDGLGKELSALTSPVHDCSKIEPVWDAFWKLKRMITGEESMITGKIRMITRTTFEEVKHHATKSVKCSSCNKTLRRQKIFSQTLNPFNKNKDGSLKTRFQIKDELVKDASQWRETPTLCGKCE
jgi:hypothetical protein